MKNIKTIILLTLLAFAFSAAQDRGTGTVLTSNVSFRSGIPLGGIGTGTVEIRPDGTLQDWQIFNLGSWAYDQPEEAAAKTPEMKMRFYLRAQQEGGAPVVRRLCVNSDEQDLYNLAWLKNVQEVSFTGQYPVARLKYKDNEIPLSVRSMFYSPFIPHEARISATPGFYAVFHIKNTSDKTVSLSLLTTMKNPLAWEASDRELINEITQQNDATTLTMRTSAKKATGQTLGSVSLSVKGGTPSWIMGDFSSFLNLTDNRRRRGAYGNVYESVLHDFRLSGTLPSLAGDRSPEQFLKMTDAEIEALPAGQKKEWVNKLRTYAWFESLAKRVLEVEDDALSKPEGMTTFLKECRNRLNDVCGKERNEHPWGDGALCSGLTLKPGEEKEVTITMSWFFPNHYSALGPVIGHMYENWFKDAGEVNNILVSNAERFTAQTKQFADALYETSMGTEMADAWSTQLTTLVKSTWWVKNGDFGVWEGLGCCGFHTTDITYQGSFNILALFPDLQKRQMTMGARCQRADGRVHHSFAPDLSQVDNGFDRVDMNPQFVLLACRDYLWTGDKEYIKILWPHIVRAMKNSLELDADGDGLPDHDTQRNTYDLWNFFGTPSYISSLWLGGLKAAIRIAEDLGEVKQADEWQQLLKKGSESFVKKLWNGEYFSLWVDKDKRDECCMSDQISGEWFTQLIGIGNCLSKERVTGALRAVYKNNFTRENGLINASYPSGGKLHFSTYRNVQAMAPWTGIEYAMASMMFEFGMPEEAQAIVSAVSDRYLRAGLPWSHEECGSHYYRAMSSWAVLLSSTGFKVDAPRSTVTFAPAVKNERISAPWISSDAWGSFSIGNGKFDLTCSGGTMSFKTLRLGAVSGISTAKVNGTTVDVKIVEEDGIAVLNFKRQQILNTGDRFVVQ